MTFDPRDALLGAWQGVATSVNEADYSCVIWYTAGLKERQRRGVGVVVRRWSCPAHTGNEVCSWCGRMAMRSYGHVEAVCFLGLWASGGPGW